MDKQVIWFFLKTLKVLLDKGLADDAKKLIEEMITEMERSR